MGSAIGGPNNRDIAGCSSAVNTRDRSPRNPSSQVLPACLCAHAFTLIEILVCVAIIALLALLGVPFLKRSIDTANNAKCKANMKTCASAILAYAADNNGFLPPNGPVDKDLKGSHVTHWALGKTMEPYGLKWPSKATLCPAEDQPHSLRPDLLSSYAIPGVLSPGSRWSGPNYGSGPWPRISQLHKPARVILLWEFFARHYGDKPGSMTIGGPSNPPPTHNVIFLDGHAGTFKSDVPWLNLETHWRNYGNGGKASLADRVHVLLP